jgi:hypothetical protein
MNTKEINLHHLNFVAIDLDLDRYSSDESKQLIFLSSTDTKDHSFLTSWWSKSPSQKGNTVIESETSSIILYVMLV